MMPKVEIEDQIQETSERAENDPPSMPRPGVAEKPYPLLRVRAIEAHGFDRLMISHRLQLPALRAMIERASQPPQSPVATPTVMLTRIVRKQTITKAARPLTAVPSAVARPD